MADEIDVGRLVAEIVLETKQARENAEEIKEKLEQIGSKTVKPQISDENISKVNDKLGKTEKVTKQVETASEKLKRSIAEQEQKLNGLKQAYADTALEQGKSSDEAKKLEDEIDRLSKELETNKAKLNDSAYSAKNLGKELNKTSENAKKSSDGFTVMKGVISNLVSDVLNVAIDKFKEMSVSADKSLNNLQAKTGMSAEAVGELKTEMLDLYKNNYGDSLTDVADKIALVTQNIDESDPEKIKEITQNAIGLSDTFGSDFEENLRGVNGLITNMGLTADEAFDLIAKGSQNGLDKTHELTDNLAEYSQLWGQAGFSAQEMFSILQNGLDSGAYKLDNVNDLVKEISISIIDGRVSENIDSFSEKTKQLFESFENGGATQREVFNSIINDLSNTTNLADQLATASRNWSALGEDNAMSVITALNNVNDTYKDVSGTMQEINNIQYEDVGSQVQALGRQFEVDILQPVVEKATPKIKEFISWVSDHLPEVTSALAGLVTSVVTFKTATAAGNFLKTMIDGFKSLKPAIEGATEAQLANNAATKANLYVAVASAILGIVAATTTWINTNYKAVDALGDVNKLTEELEANATQQRQTVDIEIEQINSLNTVYDELRNKTSLTADEKSTLASVSEELASKLGIEESNLKDVDGKYKDLTKSIDDYIKKAHQRVELSIVESSWESTAKELENTKQELEQALKDKGYSEDGILDAAGVAILNQYKEKIDLLEEKIKDYKNQYDALLHDIQETQGMMTVNEALNAKNSSEVTDKATKSIKNKTETTDKATKSIKAETEAVEDLSKTMSTLSAMANTVTNAEKEYKETQTLTASTLQAIIDKYPELEDEVYKYIAGVTDAKTLIASMKNTYNDDANAFLVAQVNKNANNADFYKNVMLANTEWVNDCKNKYNIDLTNYATWAQARSNITSKLIKVISTLPGIGQLLGNALTSAQDTWFDYILSQYTSKFVTAKNSVLNLQNINTSNSNNRGSSTSLSSNTPSSSSSSSKKDNKYDLASEAYNRLVDKRIEKIDKEAEAAEKAKDRKIAAINAEIEARKRLNEDADRTAELEKINAQLKYAQLDKLSRRELERKRQDLLNEQTEVNWERMMSDKKDRIESDYSKQSQSYDKATEALQQAAESAKNYFSRLAGTQTNSQIVNNNSDTRNIQIVANALSNQQMLDKLLNALYSK